MMADGSGNHTRRMPLRDPSTFDHPPANSSPLATKPLSPGQRVKNLRDGKNGWILRIDPNGDIWFRPDGTPPDYCHLEHASTLSPTAWMADHGIDGDGEIVRHRPNPSKARGYIVPGARERVADLQSQMTGIHQIKPVVSSRYLVKGWLDRGTLSVVYGESNVGKTFFALDVSMHVAALLDLDGNNRDWHGVRVRRGSVVYVAGEGGSGINNRIEAIRLNRPELTEGLDGTDFILMKTALDLCGPTDAAALCEAFEDFDHVDLVVIDTLAMAFGSGDENTAKDMGAFVQNCRHIRTATGAHVMVIHHSGKDTSKGARGSGSLRAASDTEIELTRDGDVIVATQRKQRDMQVGKPFAYTLKSVFIGDDEDGEKVFSAVVMPTEAPAKRPPRLKGQALIAMQAFADAVKDHGVTKGGEDFPVNRKCVSLDHWREACDRHSLTSGDGESSKRTAFHKAWKGLQERGVIRVLDGFAWRCADD